MTIPEIIIISVYVLLLGTTVVAALSGTRTVSQSMTRWGWRARWFATLNGVMVGHWWVTLKWLDVPVLHSWPLALIPVALAGAVDLTLRLTETKMPRALAWPLWWVLIGMVSGAFLWGM